MKQPSKDIIEFVKARILPVYEVMLEYKRNHIDYVLRRSILFASQVMDEPVDVDMVYLIAAYHDLGEIVDRKTHEHVGAKMLREDERLQKFFTQEQIEIMAQAVEDHRASGKTEPRTVYGRIVSSADRTTSVDDIMRLSYGFRADKGMSLHEMIDDGYKHLCEKYGENGYALGKMYFDDPEFEEFKKQTIALSKDRKAYEERFLMANGIKLDMNGFK